MMPCHGGLKINMNMFEASRIIIVFRRIWKLLIRLVCEYVLEPEIVITLYSWYMTEVIMTMNLFEQSRKYLENQAVFEG